MGFKEIAVFCELTYVEWGLQKLSIILESKVPPNFKVSKKGMRNVFFIK